jgi:hypothetical protein
LIGDFSNPPKSAQKAQKGSGTGVVELFQPSLRDFSSLEPLPRTASHKR